MTTIVHQKRSTEMNLMQEDLARAHMDARLSRRANCDPALS